jgi:hypothetical protein
MQQAKGGGQPSFSAEMMANKNKQRQGQFPLPDADNPPITLGMLIDLGNAMFEAKPRDAAEADINDIPAGYTYFGQFINHDLQHFATSATPIQSPYDTKAHPPITPALSLQTLYGEGLADRRLHLCAVSGKFKLQRLGVHEFDVSREADGAPAIADQRNDEHLLLLQFHLLFMRFHNVIVEQLNDAGMQGEAAFNEARERVTATYQYLIVHDYLKRILWDNIWTHYFACQGPTPALFSEQELASPNAFNTAVFRFGHAMVRPEYFLNNFHQPPRVQLTELFNYRAASEYFTQGHEAIPHHCCVDWRCFFYTPEQFKTSKVHPQRAMRIKPISKVQLPMHDWPINLLAVRNLLRGHMRGIPSAQVMISKIEGLGLNIANTPMPMLSAETMDDPELSLFQAVANGEALKFQTPLWYYTLREARYVRTQPEYRARGILGPVASVVMADVFKQVLQKVAKNYAGAMNKRMDNINSIYDLVSYVYEQE